MTTYVREGEKGKWHVARGVARGGLTPTLCNRNIYARQVTCDRTETTRAGLCYQCGKKAQ